MRTRRTLGVGIAISFVSLSALAAPTPTDAKMGRDLFDRGVHAAKAEDWSGAESFFTQAYAVYPRPAILASLAGAQAKAGHVTQAVATYRKLLQDPGDLGPTEISAFKSGAAATEARVAWVRVEIVSPHEGDRVAVDDARVAPESLADEIPVDPGVHAVKLLRSGADAATISITLGDGEHRKVALAVAASQVAPLPPPSSRVESRSLFVSPWFWTAVGAVVVLSTATVLCVATLCRSDDGYQGGLGSVRLR